MEVLYKSFFSFFLFLSLSFLLTLIKTLLGIGTGNARIWGQRTTFIDRGEYIFLENTPSSRITGVGEEGQALVADGPHPHLIKVPKRKKHAWGLLVRLKPGPYVVPTHFFPSCSPQKC